MENRIRYRVRANEMGHPCTPAPLLTFCRSTFPAAYLGCGRTLLGLLAALSAGLRSVFAASQNPPHPHHGRKRAKRPVLITIFALLALTPPLEATAATIDARQFCKRSLIVRLAILDQVLGASATCEPGDPEAPSPDPARYETTLTSAQLASIRTLDLHSVQIAVAQRLSSHLRTGDLDGLTGVRILFLRHSMSKPDLSARAIPAARSASNMVSLTA